MCNLYDLDIVLEPDPCLTAVDDAFEPNDVCGSAATLSAGLTSGLFVSTGSEDYYKISVPHTDQVVIDQTWTQVLFGANPQMQLYSDPGCSVEVDLGAWGAGSNQVVYGNATGATTDFYLKVSLLDGVCVDYDLNVTLQPDPCILTPDDSFEPNDDCLSAVPLGAGMHTGLFARDADPDWYSVTIPAGQVVTIEQTYNPVKDMGIDRHNDNLGVRSVRHRLPGLRRRRSQHAGVPEHAWSAADDLLPMLRGERRLQLVRPERDVRT